MMIDFSNYKNFTDKQKDLIKETTKSFSTISENIYKQLEIDWRIMRIPGRPPTKFINPLIKRAILEQLYSYRIKPHYEQYVKQLNERFYNEL